MYTSEKTDAVPLSIHVTAGVFRADTDMFVLISYKWRTESMSTTSKASQRINALLDDNSFVEIGALVTARATDFNMKPDETPSDGCITG